MRLGLRRSVLAALAATTTTVALASPFGAAAYASDDEHEDHDINDDHGQTEDEVEHELWNQTATDTIVLSEYKKYVAAQKAAETAQARYNKAKAHAKKAHGAEKARANAALAKARRQYQTALNNAANAKGAWELATEARLAEIQGQHHGGQGQPGAGTGTPGTGTGSTPSTGPVNGKFTGKVSRKNPFGDVQVTIVVTDGKITDCSATAPMSGTSGDINRGAIPTLCGEAIAAQSASVGAVGGASYTSPAFKDSLADAIRKAGI